MDNLTLIGVVGGDTVTLTPDLAFADMNVANSIVVSLTASSSLGGAGAGNYSLSLVGAPTTTANITTATPPVNNTTTSSTTQLSAFEVPRFPPPGQSDMTTYQVNTFVPQMGAVYFYQPPTPYDMAAFDMMMLDAGNLQFLDGFISLLGHEGLMPGFDDRRRLHGVS